MKLLKTADAAGHALCHDITRIVPGVAKEELTAFKRSLSTVSRPDAAAISSILPSFGAVALILRPRQISRRISAASFSCSILSSFSQT